MKIQTDYICVVDLEATCTDAPARPGEARLVNEIIEIGAVMVKLNGLEPIGEFQSFIKPCQSEKLTAFCTGLTSITQADVDRADGFDVVHAKWAAWLDKYDIGTVLLGSYGLYDYKQIMKDCAYHVLPFPFRGDHLNIKEYVPTKFGWGKKGVGQQKALKRLGIAVEGVAHRGIDDARMATKLLQRAAYAGEEGHWYRTGAHEVMRGYSNG